MASAKWLEKQRGLYEDKGVFSARMIDGIIRALNKQDDSNLRESAEKDSKLMQKLVESSFYCG